MQPRATTAAATLAAMSIMLTMTTPAAAAPGDAAPEQRVTVAEEAGAIGLAMQVRKDGNGPFTPDDQPGGDTSASNGTVRTLDAITYRVTMNSNGGSSTNETFTLTAPDGTSWAGVPADCAGDGSTVRGKTLTCNLGTVAEGHAVFVDAVLNVSGDRKNGDEIAVDATGTADDAAPVTATSPTTTVSAAARYNLSKDVQASVLRTGVAGPDGTPGIQLLYPIAVDWQPIVAGQGLLGFEKSAGPMRFTDDVSKILGTLPSNAGLWNGGQAACGINMRDESRMGGLPAGKGSGANAVTDSGTVTCEQSAPGKDIDVTITDTVTDPSHTPTTNVTGGPIAGGVKPYFVTGFISLWMPTPPDDTSVESVNTYTPLQTTSVSGAQNFPGGTEPTTDNSAKRNIIEYAAGGASKYLYRDVDDGTAIEDGSAKQGDPWVTEGTDLHSVVEAWNNGLAPYDGAVLCDTFDRSTQRLHRVKGNAATWSGFENARIQYAAYDMASPEDGQKRTCDDGDGPWYDAPEDVPGGIDAVGAVRVTGDVLGGRSVALHTYVVVEDAPDGTRAYDFGHAGFGDRATEWLNDRWSDAELGAGPLSDSVIITENLARIEKKIIDVGHDAEDTPDATSVAVAGHTIDYALYPTLTNGKANGETTDVVVRDVLPANVDYVNGSASIAPTVDSVDGDDGTHRQRLTWTLEDVQPNTPIDPISFTATVSKRTPEGSIVNRTDISSPTDKSDVEYREAYRAVQIVAAGGVGVEKTAVEPVEAVGDTLEWKLGYTNTDSTPIDELDVIDVLPYRGDARNSSFHGTVGLATAVEVDAAAGERVLYTTAKPDQIELDGDAASNQTGGSTTWCAAADLGTAGCPDDLDDVTAFRILRTAPVAAGESITHTVELATHGERNGDAYTNRFGLRASNLALPVLSNPATIRIVAGAIGDRVWSDDDEDGLQDDGEAGIGNLPVHLTGTDDRGAGVARDTTTDADGGYLFDGLRPGEYVVVFTAPDGRTFTTEHVGDDPATDSDADAVGRTPAVTIAWQADEGARTDITRDRTIDAGITPGDEEPVTPVDPTEPTDPGATADPARPGTPSEPTNSAAPGQDPDDQPSGTAAAANAQGRLAFTGAEGLSIGITAAVLLLLVGAILLGTNRNRRKQR